jgi:UDP-glucose 4-epimerase
MKNIYHLKNKIEVIVGDIRDELLVESLIKRVDVIIHLAAAVGVKTITEYPIESMLTNFAGSEIVLRLSAQHDKRILIASTSEIYGKNFKQPLSEDDDRVIGAPQILRWSYSEAKALEESMAFALFLEKNLRVTTVRFFNTVGPRQTGEYGMVIPRFTSAAMKNEPINVYGDGSQTRVFCHVEDTVIALNKLVKTEDSYGQTFNIGGIGEISIIDLAKKIIEITNSKSEIKFIEFNKIYSGKFEDMQRRVPDISKIKKFISWSPNKSLDDIIFDVSGLTSRET